MRRVVLSVCVNKRERPHAFVRHATTMSKMILRRAFPKYDRRLSKRSHPRISDQLRIEEMRWAKCGLARPRNVNDIAIDQIGRRRWSQVRRCGT